MASVEPNQFTWVTRPNGTPYKKASPDSRWRARWRTPEGQSREQWFDRKIDAEQHLTSVEHRKLTGAYVDPQAGKVTVEVFAEEWRAVQVHRPSTAAQVESNLRRHVYPHLGQRPVGAVRPSEVQAWVRGRSHDLSPATVELVYRYLSSIFKAAVADRIITTSPCVNIRLPKQEPARVEPITVEQVRVLLAEIPDRYKALVVVAAGSGLRQGEAFGLTVDRVDFLRRTIIVDRQLVLVRSGPPAFAPLKTDASYRTLPVPALVIDALSAHLAKFGPGPDRLVFTNDAGAAIRRPRFSDVWQPAARAAGLERGIGMHALRHFYASALIHHGESVKVVQSRLGHATAAETLDTYSHLWPDSEDKTRAAVDAVLGGVGLSWGAAAKTS
jgi:integrase